MADQEQSALGQILGITAAIAAFYVIFKIAERIFLSLGGGGIFASMNSYYFGYGLLASVIFVPLFVLLIVGSIVTIIQKLF